MGTSLGTDYRSEGCRYKLNVILDVFVSVGPRVVSYVTKVIAQSVQILVTLMETRRPSHILLQVSYLPTSYCKSHISSHILLQVSSPLISPLTSYCRSHLLSYLLSHPTAGLTSSHISSHILLQLSYLLSYLLSHPTLGLISPLTYYCRSHMSSHILLQV